MRSPGRTQLLTRAAAGAVTAYQVAVSPFLGANCRFQPTCSEYTRQAILTHGLCRGVAMATKRISRCHPWHAGGYDPVPCADADDAPTTTHAPTTRPHTS
jgi:putative membrane protein insertion efficiency factor